MTVDVIRIDEWHPGLNGLLPETELFAKLRFRTTVYWYVHEDGLPLILVGGIPTTLLSNEIYLWAHAFPKLSAKHVRALRAAFERELKSFSQVWMHVAPTETCSIRFARFFGLTKDVSVGGLDYYVRAA